MSDFDTTNSPQPASDIDKQTRQWAMFLHLSQLLNCLLPIAGIIAPIVIWQIKKDELPGIDAHGKMVVNWIISLALYFVISFLLVLLVIGVPLLLALSLVSVVFPIIGGIKANNGELWKYPLSLNFLK